MKKLIIVLLALVLLTACAPTETTIVTLPEISNLAPVAVTATDTPSPPLVIIETPEPKPIQTPDTKLSYEEFATQTAEAGVEETARMVVNICKWHNYYPIIADWNSEKENKDRQLDENLILAVMAKESHCNPYADDGVSVGVMAVTPRPNWWTREQLLNVRINIYAGMNILANAIEQSDGDIRTALAAYNCGWESLNAGKCIPAGGYTYADDVINFWLPRFEEIDNGK
jgi:soluble lytic murein transglycosylase-like protein